MIRWGLALLAVVLMASCSDEQSDSARPRATTTTTSTTAAAERPCSVEAIEQDAGGEVGDDVAILKYGCVDGWAIVDTVASCAHRPQDEECNVGGDGTVAVVRVVDGRWTQFRRLLNECVKHARAWGMPAAFDEQFTPDKDCDH